MQWWQVEYEACADWHPCPKFVGDLIKPVQICIQVLQFRFQNRLEGGWVFCARAFVRRHRTFVRPVLDFRVWARVCVQAVHICEAGEAGVDFLEWARRNGGTEVLARFWRVWFCIGVLVSMCSGGIQTEDEVRADWHPGLDFPGLIATMCGVELCVWVRHEACCQRVCRCVWRGVD